MRNETVIEPSLVVNGDHWDEYAATPGTSLPVDSLVDGWQLCSVTDVPRTPEYLEPVAGDEEDENLSFDAMANMEFEIFYSWNFFMFNITNNTCECLVSIFYRNQAL